MPTEKNEKDEPRLMRHICYNSEEQIQLSAVTCEYITTLVIGTDLSLLDELLDEIINFLAEQEVYQFD